MFKESNLNSACNRSIAFNPRRGALAVLAAILSCASLCSPALAPDWIKTGTGLGVEPIRLAVPEFKTSHQDPRNAGLLRTINHTPWKDLDNTRILALRSK